MWYFGGSSLTSSGIGYAESDTRIPYLFVTNNEFLIQTDTLNAKIYLDGVIYIVPDGTTLVIDSIVKYMVVSVDASAQSEVQIPLTDISIGYYTVVAVSTPGFVSTNPFLFKMVDSKPPILELANDTVIQGDTIFVSSDKDGTIYLVVKGSTPEDLPNEPKRIKDSSAVTAGIPIGFPTADLFPKEYWLYAEDEYSLFSEADTVTVDFAEGLVKTTVAGINLFPVPTRDLLTIETEQPDQYSIEIISLSGQLVYRTTMNGSSGRIDLSSIQQGLYFITVRSRDYVRTEKIIKL